MLRRDLRVLPPHPMAPYSGGAERARKGRTLIKEPQRLVQLHLHEVVTCRRVDQRAITIHKTLVKISHNHPVQDVVVGTRVQQFHVPFSYLTHRLIGRLPKYRDLRFNLSGPLMRKEFSQKKIREVGLGTN
jgi:hypothetical protein